MFALVNYNSFEFLLFNELPVNDAAPCTPKSPLNTEKSLHVNDVSTSLFPLQFISPAVLTNSHVRLLVLRLTKLHYSKVLSTSLLYISIIKNHLINLSQLILYKYNGGVYY